MLLKIESFLAKIYRTISGNYGIIKDKEDPRNHEHLGFMGHKKTVLFKDNYDLLKNLPEGERQNAQGEKMNCVTQSALNSLETQINRMIELEKTKKANKDQIEILKVLRYFGIVKNDTANFSKRYTAKMSGTTWRGNSYSKVWNSIRNHGLLAEEDYPDVRGWDNYYKKIFQETQDKAKRIYDFIEIKYERVNEDDYDDSYKYSPVQTAINSPGRKLSNDIYVPLKRSNHAVAAVKDDPEFRLIFDSYPNFLKKYTYNHNYGRGVIGHIKLKKKFTPFNYEEIEKLRGRGLKYLLRVGKGGEVWVLKKTSVEYMGKINNSKEFNEDAVKAMSRLGQLTGISEEDFKKLYI